MIFTRFVPALLVAAVSAQALYIPEVLYAREFEESGDVAARELSKRGLDHLNVVLAARGIEEHNPVDHHSHGGGESKTAEDRYPVSHGPEELNRRGQKINPIAFRLGIVQSWNSRWFVSDKKKPEDGKKPKKSEDGKKKEKPEGGKKKK
jgi:hypothetical protein